MPFFKGSPGPGFSSGRPVSSKFAYLALNLALWDRLASIKKVLARFPDPLEAFRVTAGEWPAFGLGSSAVERLCAYVMRAVGRLDTASLVAANDEQVSRRRPSRKRGPSEGEPDSIGSAP